MNKYSDKQKNRDERMMKITRKDDRRRGTYYRYLFGDGESEREKQFTTEYCPV